MKKLILLSVTALISAILLATLIPENKGFAEVDFERPMATINIAYGINENGNWEMFSDSAQAQQLHRQLQSEYMRVWVSSQWYRPSTIPVHSDGSVEYTNLDRFVNAALNSGTKPMLVFAHAPGTYGEGHGEPPPADLDDFASYVANTVEHYKEKCDSNQMIAPCDVNDWYFEVWNEPFTDIWWEDDPALYIMLFNKVAPKIKMIAPGAKVGGYGIWYMPDRQHMDNNRVLAFISQTNTDFVDLHHYGNIIDEYASEKQKMRDVKKINYDYIVELKKIAPDIEIINGEYSSDYRATYMEHLDEQFTAAWYASALIWQIKSGSVTMELFYSGTSLHTDKGFAMWNRDLQTWPVFDMKKQFVQVNKKGSTIYAVETDIYSDALLVSNDEGRFLTVVNKNDHVKYLELSIEANKLIDMRNSEIITVNEYAIINLEPYEVRFFKVE